MHQRLRLYQTRPGARFPQGATWSREGVNFSIFSRDARHVDLLLYESEKSEAPFQIITLDPEEDRTFFSWNIFVEELPVGTFYTWRIELPDGTRREILDPWARTISDANWNRIRALRAPSQPLGLRGMVTDTNYDWDNSPPGPNSLEGAVIYEMHVGAFTRHVSAGAEHPGTFAALTKKIPYLKALGITHVELLPVMAFDEQDVPFSVAARGLKNFWGYSTLGFYSPHPRYCVTLDQAREFKNFVKAMHEAGLGVILDVVFNHTSEGGVDGPTIHFKALAEEIFYHTNPHGPQRYRDYTGCGNTVNCNHPLVTRFIVHCLEYWREMMGVDGFRFDLASVFARDENGVPMANPPLPWSIELSSKLYDVPLIAEAWDAAGLYQVGSFPGLNWSEWNGRYRDVIRRFVRGDRGLVSEVATCIAGSSDLYANDNRLPTNSINFVTCHDGFTLWDLVSYDSKHNIANGEENRDGSDNNLSWNCGAEGDTSDAKILALRRQQARNLMAILFLSQGVPMILAGDEVLRSQRGNNNAWCQDNELSWFDWRLTEVNADMLRFVRELIAFRARHRSLRRGRFLSGRPEPLRGLPDVTWHGEKLHRPMWNDGEAQVLAFTLAGRDPEEEDVHVVMNMSESRFTASLPTIPGRRWHLAADTSAAAPNDIIPREKQTPLAVPSFPIRPRSVIIFEARQL